MTGNQMGNRKGWRLSAKMLVISTLITILGFSAVCVSIMLDMRHSEEELARQTSENLASTIDADISRNLEIFDLSLRAVTTNLQASELKSVSRELRNLILFDHAATAKHFGALQVFDRKGQLIIDASSLDPAPINVGTEEFFTIQRDNPGYELFISRPIMHAGAYSVMLSRRIDNPDGSFNGVVAGAIRFSYFHNLFSRLQLENDDSITVMRRDGIVMMRVPFDVNALGKDVSSSPVAQQAMIAPSGAMSGIGAFDGISRLYVWRDATRPLLVIVGKPWANVYAMWRNQAIRISAVMLLLIAFAVTVTLFLGSEISRRARAEDTLEEMATTDALTGLRNRRKFDTVLEQEWRRAERNQTPLALLMIDADHFKSYNDRFGHQAGDEALSAIAGCIAIAARRAGDCAARYGGEEFAVLLTGLSDAAALQIAETIRRDVAMLDGAQAPLTVSIGIAAIVPQADAGAVTLLEAADKALYVAKAKGRNQCRLAPGARMAIAA